MRGNRCKNPKADRCVAYVCNHWDGGQCDHRRNATTRDGEWCKQHCPDLVAAKREAREAKYKAGCRARYKAEVDEAQAPYMRAAARAVEWAEADGRVTPAQADCLRAAILELAEEAAEGVSRWGVE